MCSAAFEMIVPVLADDIDEQNHVNNTVYLRWVQDVATAHWRAITSPEAQEMIGWVVLRHEIDYKTPATLAPRSGVRAIASSSRRRARSGVPSILKPAGQCECPGKCARNFPSDPGCLTSRLAIASCTLMISLARSRCQLMTNQTAKNLAFWARRHAAVSRTRHLGLGQFDDVLRASSARRPHHLHPNRRNRFRLFWKQQCWNRPARRSI